MESLELLFLVKYSLSVNGSYVSERVCSLMKEGHGLFSLTACICPANSASSCDTSASFAVGEMWFWWGFLPML